MKKLSIFLISLFSIFIFIPGVKAEEDIKNFCDYTEPCFSTEVLNQLYENKNIDKEIYDSYVITIGNYENSSKRIFGIYIFNSEDLNNKSIYFDINDSGDLNIHFKTSRKYSFYNSTSYVNSSSKFNYLDSVISTAKAGNTMGNCILTYDTSFFIYYTNVDLIDKDNNILYNSNVSKSYEVTFHLNGGSVTDSYQSNLEKNVFVDEMTNIINSNGLLDKYPSIKNEWLKIFNEPSMEKLQNFFEKFLTDVNTQAKLILIYQKLIDKEYSQPVNYYEDFTIPIQVDKLKDYLYNLDFKKDGMSFKGLYYDKNFTQKVETDDILDSNKDFYAKFVYDNVDDFLNNTTFITYTFDTDYEYAVISLNDKTNRDIYLGLDFMSYNLEVYKYDKANLKYGQGSNICLTPYFSKDDKYYYYLNSPLDEDYEAIIIPKGKFKENYTFLLSTNAYVTYTNDLTDTVIKDDDGNDLHTNLSDAYNYAQDALLNDGNDILEIFKNLMENKDNNVFAYINQIWNYLKRSKLYTYLLTLIIGSLVILIIKVARR